ncbi:MAG: sulfotransferase domain-containing protein [Parvibaculum sp.]|nr:sulfotransferase domain-containing protein [Parvibaculum sp.]
MSVTKPVPIPNTFLAGAPKCGTTSLANWLSEHPDIFLPAKKEPHFFNAELNNCGSFASYLSLYEGCPASKKILLDGSTSYFTSKESISRIVEATSAPKFVVMLRNPVELVRSWHSECLFLARENVEDFEAAWKLQDERRQGRHIPPSCKSPSSLLYKDQAMLGAALRNLLDVAGRENVFWLYLGDMIADPRKAYLSVLEFLGVKDDGRTEFPVLNKAKTHRFPMLNRLFRVFGGLRRRLGLPGIGAYALLKRHGRVEKTNKEISDEFKMELYREFETDIALLQELTGRDLRRWNPALRP